MNTLPWGTNQNLTDDEFYNRKWELDTINTFLETTANGNSPKVLLTGIRGVGKTVFLKKSKENWMMIIWFYTWIFPNLNAIRKTS